MWRLKAPKKNDANMILDGNAYRLAIYINWGDRQHFFFEIHKTNQDPIKNKVTLCARSS